MNLLRNLDTQTRVALRQPRKRLGGHGGLGFKRFQRLGERLIALQLSQRYDLLHPCLGELGVEFGAAARADGDG